MRNSTTRTSLTPAAYYYTPNNGSAPFVASKGYSWYRDQLITAVTDTVRRPKPQTGYLLRVNGANRQWTVTKRFDSGFRRRFTEPGYSILEHASVYDRAPEVQGFAPSIPNVDGRLRLKIKEQTGNLLQDLAEFRQTRNLLTSGCRDVLRAFHSLRSGRALSDFVRILSRPRSVNERAIANQWLRYQYGVRPLLSSIYDYSEALAVRVRTGMTLHARARAVNSGGIRISNTATGYGSGELIVEVRKVASYRVSDSTLKELSEIGITNPALVAWELIPYSFVIDQFVNVGRFLSSLDALLGIDQLVVTGTQRHKDFRVSRPHFLDGTAWVQINTTVRYSPATTLALPRISFGLPGSNLGSRLASMLGLLRQLRR